MKPVKVLACGVILLGGWLVVSIFSDDCEDGLNADQAELLRASRDGDTAAVDRLVKAKVNVNGDICYPNPIANAISHGHVQVVKQLLAAGADPTLKNDQGLNAFDLAKTSKESQIRNLLGKHRFSKSLRH